MTDDFRCATCGHWASHHEGAWEDGGFCLDLGCECPALFAEGWLRQGERPAGAASPEPSQSREHAQGQGGRGMSPRPEPTRYIRARCPVCGAGSPVCDQEKDIHRTVCGEWWRQHWEDVHTPYPTWEPAECLRPETGS